MTKSAFRFCLTTLLAFVSAGSLAQGYTPLFMVSECPVFMRQLAAESRAEVSCGYLVVPEDREDSDSERSVELFTLRIAGRQSLENAPLIYISGGPGSSIAGQIADILRSRLLERYEIIAIDQRGAGLSRPSLSCSELDAQTSKTSADWLEDCYARLNREGVGLHAYNGVNIANDIHDLLVALQIDTANVYGFSYGSRLALLMARDFPMRVRSLILDGVLPLHVDRFNQHALNGYQALERLFDRCASAPDCKRAYPDLRGAFLEVIQTLNQKPATMPGSDEHHTGDDFVYDVLAMLYDRRMIPYLPAQIMAFAQGDFSVDAAKMAREHEAATTTASDALASLDHFSEGLWLSVSCAADESFNSRVEIVDRASTLPALVRRPLVAEALDFLSKCRRWLVPRLPALENQLVVSQIPTLLLSGYFDPVTPPHWGEEAAQYLAVSWRYVMPDGGHGALFAADDECAVSIALDFLSDPIAEPARDCLTDQGPIDFHIHMDT